MKKKMLQKKRSKPFPIQKKESNKILELSNDNTENKQITHKYLTVNKKNIGNDINLPLINKSFSSHFSKIKMQKKDYKLQCEELYDNKNKAYYQVRTAKLLLYSNKNILFIQLYNKLVLYEIKNDSFIFKKEFLFKDFGAKTTIDKFFFLEKEEEMSKEKNKKNIIFISSKEIILSKLDLDKYKFSLFDIKSISITNYESKIFHKIIGGNKILVSKNNLLYISTLYPSFCLTHTSISNEYENFIVNISILDNNNIIGICKEKEIIIYEVDKNRTLGVINIDKKDLTNPGVRITRYLNDNGTLFIYYSEKGVYLFDYKQLSLIKKLSLEKIIKSKIRKVKSLTKNNIAILYNYYNLIIYNAEKNMILYRYNSNWTKSPGNEDFPILEKISNDIIAFGSDPKTVTVLNHMKGDVLGHICNKEKNINCILCKSMEIYDENKMKRLDDSLIYSFIKNSKSTLLLKISY